ncbi:right-handed parallel beta-helix repeat-containing protein [Miltoncostaea oceani]|uniref:right-handed parallel beta-helix repeat-containing protein n=1 Tax=Miltoncostaea oceani TaxID=2843216 RepID=UPI001C3D7250|nr:right-handed parallel beta-helix repeat-containing protein [Miltoncostaea oceani]
MVRARPVRRALPVWVAGAALAAVALVALAPASPAAAAPACTKYASLSGSDSAAGTESAPFRTSQKLVDSLSSGQVGCLQPGATFGGVKVNRSGITLTTAPGGAKATILGKTWVPEAANDVVFDGLVINGRTSGARVSPDVQGDRVVFRNNDITNDNTAICLHIGSNIGSGIAYGVVVDSNRIFRCGRMPATGFDHGIYVNHAYDTRITNNLIFDNADYGVHLYPGANRTYVANNVIDGNGRGVTFSGEGGLVSSNNLVENNVISNSLVKSNVESWWASGVGVGNRADRNCMFNGRTGNVNLSNGGFTASDNITADPMFTNRAAKDFTLRAGSPCLGKVPAAGLTPSPPPSLGPPDVPVPSTPVSNPLKPRSRTSPDSGDRSMSQPLTPRQRVLGPAARPTQGQVVTHRRMVVRLLTRVGRLERRVLGTRTAAVPEALTTRPRVSAAEMRATRMGAADALRRVTILLNRVSGRSDAVPRTVVPRRVPATIGQVRATEVLARATVRRATLVERLLARR